MSPIPERTEKMPFNRIISIFSAPRTIHDIMIKQAMYRSKANCQILSVDYGNAKTFISKIDLKCVRATYDKYTFKQIHANGKFSISLIRTAYTT